MHILELLAIIIALYVTSATVDEAPTRIEPIVSESSTDMIYLNNETFHDYVKRGKHFVKFFSPNCAHSKRLAPVWEELAKFPKFHGKVSIAKVDCAANLKLCTDSDIAGYPTLIWFENGKQVKRYSGFRDFVNLRYFIYQMMKKADEKKEEVVQDNNTARDDDTTELTQEVTTGA